MCILGTKELRKSEDLGEEEWDKYDGRWIWKKYRGTQHTVLLNISPFSPFLKKKTLLSHHFCAPLLGYISPLVRIPFLGPQLPLTHLSYSSCPAQYFTTLPYTVYSSTYKMQAACSSGSLIPIYRTTWHKIPYPQPPEFQIPKLNITDCDRLTNTVVPTALASSSQCPRRKSLLEPSSTSMSVNRFRNS